MQVKCYFKVMAVVCVEEQGIGGFLLSKWVVYHQSLLEEALSGSGPEN